MIKILRLEVPWYYFAKYWRYFYFLGTDVAKFYLAEVRFTIEKCAKIHWELFSR